MTHELGEIQQKKRFCSKQIVLKEICECVKSQCG